MRTLLLLIVLPVLYMSQDVELQDVRSLRCSFVVASFVEWNGDEIEFEVDSDSTPLDFYIDSIDRDNNTARMIGNQGSADLFVVPGLASTSFIEMTPSGNTNLTTVYDYRNENGHFRAVSARHITIFSSPV